MRISCPGIETQIELDEARPVVFCIENPKEYYKTVKEFIAAFNGEASDFTFWDGDGQVGAGKAGELLTDLFTFEFTDKKIITLLYKRLLCNFSEGSLIFKFQETKAEIDKFLIELCETENFALEYGEITLDALLKSYNVKPAENYQTLLEKIICYINIFTELKGICFFAFVGLKSVLSDDDLRLLYRHCRLHKLSLLLIECSKVRPILPEEKAIIITEDLCEIVENFD